MIRAKHSKTVASYEEIPFTKVALQQIQGSMKHTQGASQPIVVKVDPSSNLTVRTFRRLVLILGEQHYELCRMRKITLKGLQFNPYG